MTFIVIEHSSLASSRDDAIAVMMMFVTRAASLHSVILGPTSNLEVGSGLQAWDFTPLPYIEVSLSK